MGGIYQLGGARLWTPGVPLGSPPKTESRSLVTSLVYGSYLSGEAASVSLCSSLRPTDF